MTKSKNKDMKYTVTGQSTLKLVSLLDSCKIFYKYSKCVFYSSNLAQIFCRSMYVLAETNLPIHGKHILRALRAVEHQIFKHSLCRQLMESPHQPTSKLDDDSHKSHHCSILYKLLQVSKIQSFVLNHMVKSTDFFCKYDIKDGLNCKGNATIR